MAEEKDLSLERNGICVPIARELLAKLASVKELPIGMTVTDDERKAYFDFYVSEIIPMFLEKNVKYDYVNYIFSLMFQALTFAKDVAINSLNMNRTRAENILFKVKDNGDITINDIDNVLKTMPIEDSKLDTEVKE